jgi:protein-S-isoprenylcysteine O-methyltransferase Ste14
MNKNTLSKIGSILALFVAAAGLGFLIVKNCILSTNPVGISVQVCAVLMMIWARFTFGIRSFHAAANTTEGKLVTHGPYSIFRHPIYASIIYFVWAGVLSYLFIETIVAAVLISAGLIARMLFEEQFLRVTYAEYKEYSKRTKRLIPYVF